MRGRGAGGLGGLLGGSCGLHSILGRDDALLLLIFGAPEVDLLACI